ncbi:uncharacterized protein LAESUDRAFT_704750 [Laetiporus sulphureus 93-53]|uniref:Uncharacterized protein n=1 Tax=Laetiporus sulphureus 93-53 TaxID=1314785 RepID=A0A165CU15_9APHY|nr:uncharacterized protein LAESUDRAFT_704750 [Laetiporus sulphureus 93-53]KZT03433.1 hypothetical protein LAESUDRAFT_704750 [Laetiporus sulphureus 93-53]
MNDMSHTHSSEVHAVRACYFEDGVDLIAIGGTHTVEVLLITATSCHSVATFEVGTRVTGLAWSPNTVSPSANTEWVFELVAAGEEYSLFLLTKTSTNGEHVFVFGGGLSGHHGKINDITFCGGLKEYSTRYVATVSDDKNLMIWDLYPDRPSVSKRAEDKSLYQEVVMTDENNRAIPTAIVITFKHRLTSISAHPTASTELLIADCRGNVYLTDWEASPEDQEDEWRNGSVVELLDPRTLADTRKAFHGSAAWRWDSPDIVGALFGSRFSLWDLGITQGGKPRLAGVSFPEGGHLFRWCPTHPEYFAISAISPARGAVINIHNTSYVSAAPVAFPLAARPWTVRSFDFIMSHGVPRIAAAVGREVIIFYIGVES